jgi:hypothetical protein
MRRNSAAAWLVIVLALGLWTGPAAAQGGGDLTFDAPVSGELRDGAAHAYTFRLEEESALSARMETGDGAVDPVLELYDPAGTLLALNDDRAPDDRNAQLSSITLSQVGVYTLVARSYGQRGAGAYTLTATLNAAATLDATAPIAIDTTIRAELFVVGQVDRWTFDGQAGQTISASMIHANGTALDPLIELIGPSGAVLAYSDDDAGDVDSLINGFILPEDGVYIIVARAWGNATSGEYVLTLHNGVLAPDRPLTAGANRPAAVSTDQLVNLTGAVTVGQPVSANLAGQVADAWTLAADAGDVFSMTLVTPPGTFDPVLRVLDSAGQVVTSDDDSGLGFNSQIIGWRAPADGPYTLEVTGAQARDSGRYDLLVVDGPAFVILPGWRQGTLAIDGGPVEAAFEADPLIHVWTFDAEAGQRISIEQTGAIGLALFAMDGTDLGWLEPGQRVTLPFAGSYEVFVTGDGGTAGAEGLAYTLGVHTLPPPEANTGAVEVGQTITDVLRPETVDSWLLVAPVGETISVALYAVNGDFDPVLSIENASAGVEVAADDDGSIGQNSVIAGWRVPDRDVYLVHVRGFNDWEGGAYALSVSAGQAVTFPAAWMQGAIPADGSAAGTLTPDGLTHIWQVEMPNNGQLTVAVDDPALVLEVLDSDGHSFGQIAAGRPLLLSAGVWYIVVLGEQPGDYTLTVQQDPA